MKDYIRPHYWFVAVSNCDQSSLEFEYKFLFLNTGGKLLKQFSYDEQGKTLNRKDLIYISIKRNCGNLFCICYYFLYWHRYSPFWCIQIGAGKIFSSGMNYATQ